MKRQMLVSLLSVFIVTQFSLAEGDTLEVVGSISNVIVYRGQALVTRTIELELPAGGSQIIVQKLPHAIISETLYAQALDDVTVTSVSYREKTNKEKTSKEIKQLEAEIEEVKKKIYYAERNRNQTGRMWSMYYDLRKFAIDAENVDLNKGLLQFEPIEKLTTHIEAGTSDAHQKSVDLEYAKIELEKELEKLNSKKEKLERNKRKIKREAVLFANNLQAKKVIIELSYLVNGANWLPQYNLRANPDQGNVQVEYNAVMHQTSGEDWDKVTVSLSTAEPTMVAAPPLLEPMKVKLAPGTPVKQPVQVSEKVSGQQIEYRDLSEEFKNIQSRRREIAQKGKAAQSALNVMAIDNQMLELQADKKAVQMIQAEAKRFARTEGVSVTYNLVGKLSMPSRTDQQLVNIATFQAKGDFIMLATPLLTDYVYLQGNIVNNSDTILLAGPASMYRNGEFVGKGQLELVTIGETFTVGFGVDSQVQITREFKDKKVDTFWGNRVEKYDYRVAINNYKNTPVKLRLLERIPYTENEELVITGFKTNVPLSTDADYLRTEKDKGILRWDLTLAPVTTEKKATVITYSYSMEYDNDMHIRSAR